MGAYESHVDDPVRVVDPNDKAELVARDVENDPTVLQDAGSAMLWIINPDSARLIEFVKEAFNAEEIERVLNEDGTVGHAEFKIGDTILLAFDSRRDWPATPAFVRLYVNNAEATYQQALDAGATPGTKLTKLAFGDVVGRVTGCTRPANQHANEADGHLRRPQLIGMAICGTSELRDQAPCITM
jgi:uncharacterized glyoxalase superfamily protein PhnB